MALDFPNPPLTTGQTFTGPNNAVWAWDGVKWKASAGPTSVAIADVAPAAPLAGQLWFDSTGLQTYLWYPDPTSSQWVPLNVPPASSGALNDVGRNLVHNALYNVQQRGAGPFGGNLYNLDRWVSGNNSNLDTVSFSPIALADADRAAIGDEAALQALQDVFTGSASAGAGHYVEQRIENVRRLSNKTITVSLWARCAAGTLKIGVNAYQIFGTGGSPSAYVTVLPNGSSWTITTTWARYTMTMSFPSTAGKTFGTAGNDCTYLRFWFSAVSATDAGGIGVQSGTVQLWGVQLEVGSTATQLEKRDAQQDLAICQRFYQYGQVFMQAYTAAAVAVTQTICLPVTMRASPTITITSNADTNLTSPSQSVMAGGNVYFSGVAPSTSSGVAINRQYTLSADL